MQPKLADDRGNAVRVNLISGKPVESLRFYRVLVRASMSKIKRRGKVYYET